MVVDKRPLNPNVFTYLSIRRNPAQAYLRVLINGASICTQPKTVIFLRQLGIGTSDKEILGLAHPLARLLGESPDFRRKEALADALLNPQDRAYTVPQLFNYIEQAGLVFGRWLRQAPYLPYCGDLAQTPHTERLTQLSEKEQYTAVELFRGTMLRHSAIVYRDDNAEKGLPIHFTDKQWLNYTPHRVADTMVVEERLPEGATAVLINQNHIYTDIYLPIDAPEKQLFEAINGKRTIGSMIHSTAAGMSETHVRLFFERLWRYDQVVFEKTAVDNRPTPTENQTA